MVMGSSTSLQLTSDTVAFIVAAFCFSFFFVEGLFVCCCKMDALTIIVHTPASVAYLLPLTLTAWIRQRGKQIDLTKVAVGSSSGLFIFVQETEELKHKIPISVSKTSTAGLPRVTDVR